MRTTVNVFGPQFAELGEQFLAILHRGVVRFVTAEETPNGPQQADGTRSSGAVDDEVLGSMLFCEPRQLCVGE